MRSLHPFALAKAAAVAGPPMAALLARSALRRDQGGGRASEAKGGAVTGKRTTETCTAYMMTQKMRRL